MYYPGLLPWRKTYPVNIGASLLKFGHLFTGHKLLGVGKFKEGELHEHRHWGCDLNVNKFYIFVKLSVTIKTNGRSAATFTTSKNTTNVFLTKKVCIFVNLIFCSNFYNIFIHCQNYTFTAVIKAVFFVISNSMRLSNSKFSWQNTLIFLLILSIRSYNY